MNYYLNTKILMVSALSIVSLGLRAQGEETKSKWQIGGSFSPELCLGQFEDDAWKQYARPAFGFAGQGSVTYVAGKHLVLETGIQFIQTGYGRHLGSSVNPVTGYVFPAEDGKQLYRHIGIPIGIHYMTGGKLRFIAGAAISFQYLLAGYNQMVYTFPGGKQIFESRGFFKDDPYFNIFPSVSAGIEYQLSKMVHVRIEPVLRYSIFKVIPTDNYPHMWNAGINFGLFYKLPVNS